MQTFRKTNFQDRETKNSYPLTELYRNFAEI
jgi:hypothetical protein